MEAIRYQKSVIETGRIEGRAEGFSEGRAEGRAEGRVEGRAEGREEGIKEGRAEGQVEEQLKIARNMKNLGLSFEVIVSATGLSVGEIEKL